MAKRLGSGYNSLQLRLRPWNAELREPVNRLLRLSLDAPNQLLARRDVLDEADDDARCPDAVLGVPQLVDEAAALAGDEVADVLELGAAGAALERDDLLRDAVLEDARGVVQRAEDVYCVLLCGRDDLVFDVLVDRATGMRTEGVIRREGGS